MRIGATQMPISRKVAATASNIVGCSPMNGYAAFSLAATPTDLSRQPSSS